MIPHVDTPPLVAALFVQPRGVYYGIPGVEPWGLPERDAREYAGPHPVVAHPPCGRWCRLAGLVEKRWGYKKGDDGGTFAAALRAVRTYGGVLEHPAYSDAFKVHGIAPPMGGGWQRAFCGGWVCHVEQWHYGHRAKKATWLYAFGVGALPSMIWGRTPDNAEPAYVTDGGGDVERGRERPALVERWSSRPRALGSWCGNHVKDGEDRKRLGKKEASATPPAFRDLLLSIARSSPPPPEGRR
jgi:hypothetical protein